MDTKIALKTYKWRLVIEKCLHRGVRIGGSPCKQWCSFRCTATHFCIVTTGGDSGEVVVSCWLSVIRVAIGTRSYSP